MSEIEGPALRLMENNVEEFARNMLTLEQPFILPRDIPTDVAPHLFSHSTKISPEEGVTKGAVIFRPHPDAFLDLAEVTDQVATPFEVTEPAEFNWAPTANVLSMDQTLIMPAGHIKSSTATSGQIAQHLSNSSKQLQPGLKYWPGNFTISASDLVMGIYNPNTTAFTAVLTGGIVEPNGQAGTFITSVATVFPAKTLTNVTFLAAAGTWVNMRLAMASAALSKGFWLGCQITANLPKRFTSGFIITASGPTITAVDQIMWKRKTLWDALGPLSITAKSQFDVASRFCPTAANLIFTNVSVANAKGGSVYACRFPGDSFNELPGDIDALIALISAQTHHTSSDFDLERGVGYAHTPEKVQDWFFQEKFADDPYNGNPLNYPYLVIVWDASTALDSLPVFNLHGRIMLEYLSLDISNLFFHSPADPGLVALLIKELSKYNTLGHNNDHLKRFASIAKRIATSDSAKSFYRMALSAGIKLAPIVGGLILKFLV